MSLLPILLSFIFLFLGVAYLTLLCAIGHLFSASALGAAASTNPWRRCIAVKRPILAQYAPSCN